MNQTEEKTMFKNAGRVKKEEKQSQFLLQLKAQKKITLKT